MTTRFYSKQIDVEDPAKIELERTTVPEGAIFEPYSEVEDVAGNMFIDLRTIKRYQHLTS